MTEKDNANDKGGFGYPLLGDDFVYMAVQWLNGKPIIDGQKVFKDKMKCIKYIEDLPKVNLVDWTIAKLEIVA